METVKIKVPVTQEYKEMEIVFPCYRKWKGDVYYALISSNEHLKITTYPFHSDVSRIKGDIPEFAVNNQSVEITAEEFNTAFENTLAIIKSKL
jgi:hypothetical protein